MKNVTYNFYEKFYYISIILDSTVILIRINIIFFIITNFATRLSYINRLIDNAISRRIKIYIKYCIFKII